MNMPSIRVTDLTKRFMSPDGGGRTVLSNLSFEIQPSDRVAVLGPSGVGKTTLLRILGDLEQSYDGVVEISRTSCGDRPKVITITQEPNLFPWLTVERNLMFPLRANGVPREESKARIERVLESTQMSGFRNLYPSELSGGMKQRASFGRGIILEPSVLLLDEPFGALDAMAREEIQEEFLNWWNASRPTTVIVTHSVEEAAFLADRIFILVGEGAIPKGIIDLRFGELSPFPGEKEEFRTSTNFFRRVARIRKALKKFE